MTELSEILLTDTMMDLCVLISTQLIYGRLRLRRLLAAWLSMLAFSLASLVLGRPHISVQLAASAVCALLLTGERRPLKIVEISLGMQCIFAAAAGFASMGGSRSTMLLAPLGALILLLLLWRRRSMRFRWNVDVLVSVGRIRERFTALIDTGNCLREPRSGLPVLIVEANAVPELTKFMHNLPPESLRRLPFGVLGGGGEIDCFQPERVELLLDDAQLRAAPNCCIAIFDGRIPGKTCALAPPEFTEAAHEPTLSECIQNRVRRYGNGVFKR